MLRHTRQQPAFPGRCAAQRDEASKNLHQALLWHGYATYPVLRGKAREVILLGCCVLRDR